MSHKNLDAKNRFRSIYVGFRMSPEESADLNQRVKLSGLTKQDYIIRRLQEREIIVYGNPRVYKALKRQMELIYNELLRLRSESKVSEELQETIRLVAETFGGMNTADSQGRGI